MNGRQCHFTLCLRDPNALLNPAISQSARRHQITKKISSGDPSRIFTFSDFPPTQGLCWVSLAEIFISTMEGLISLNQRPRNVWRRWGNQLQPDPLQTHQWINEAGQASLMETSFVLFLILRLSSKNSQLIGLLTWRWGCRL